MRALWPLVWLLLFRPSPRLAWLEWWRHDLLMVFGAQVHLTARVYPSAWIAEPWSLRVGEGSTIGDGASLLGPVTLGRNACISQQAMTEGRVVMGDHSWLCARAYASGVEIGEGAVVGACSVVLADVPPWTVVAGNPAQVIKQRELKCEPSSACP